MGKDESKSCKEAEKESNVKEAAKRLEDLGLSLINLRTAAATWAVQAKVRKVNGAIGFANDDVANMAWCCLTLCATQEVILQSQMLLRAEFDLLQQKLHEYEQLLSPEAQAAGKEVFEHPVAQILTEAWEYLGDQKADHRAAVMNIGSGQIYLREDLKMLPDGNIVLGPLFVGAPTYLTMIEAICAKREDGVMSLMPDDKFDPALCEVKIRSLQTAFRAGITMHML